MRAEVKKLAEIAGTALSGYCALLPSWEHGAATPNAAKFAARSVVLRAADGGKAWRALLAIHASSYELLQLDTMEGKRSRLGAAAGYPGGKVTAVEGGNVEKRGDITSWRAELARD
ncbi:hypothetical protein FOMPIDRAFT_94956 [Fomitopsis schrenkii]|uniref:Uncharacterized protein n=1 Tax=Fomitopsis schrenkii TaxID=2126942 RepID=S8DSI7_FOMSC|nr:hypothetical protein FOMPIDRAFT_94956 [Fomitopsis schrenkii]